MATFPAPEPPDHAAGVSVAVLDVALPDAEDPWLVAGAMENGGVFTVDMRRAGCALMTVPGLHTGPVWSLCPSAAWPSGGTSGSAASDAVIAGGLSGRGGGASVLLSAGDDGALRATPLSHLRGVPPAVGGEGSPAPPAGARAPPLMQCAMPLRCAAGLGGARSGQPQAILAGDEAGRVHVLG